MKLGVKCKPVNELLILLSRKQFSSGEQGGWGRAGGFCGRFALDRVPAVHARLSSGALVWGRGQVLHPRRCRAEGGRARGWVSAPSCGRYYHCCCFLPRLVGGVWPWLRPCASTAPRTCHPAAPRTEAGAAWSSWGSAFPFHVMDSVDVAPRVEGPGNPEFLGSAKPSDTPRWELEKGVITAVNTQG